ncbi:MAG: sensor domain-containing diguanylate cyclase [Firmicutes bacterium]|nr:sensor domain-containing diguanylate cyclase [Bacillota bacterium]
MGIFRGDSARTKANPFDYSLRPRLLLLLAVMLIPFVVFSLYQAYRSYNQLMQEKMAGNVRSALEVANNVDELVLATEDLLVAISRSHAAREQDFNEMKRWFSDIAQKYPYYKNIIFVDMDGNIRAAAHTYSKPDGQIIASVKQTAYYKRAISASGLAFGDFMYAVLSKQPVIHITYPVFGTDNKRIGFVAVAFDLSHLQDRIVTIKTAKGSEVSVFDQNGTVIARTIEPNRWVGKCYAGFTRITNAPGTITGPGPDGIIRVMSFRKTRLTPWTVAVCFEEVMVRTQALKELLKQLALFLPLFLVAVIGWLWIGRDVDGLYKAARRLSLVDQTTSLGSFRKFNQDLVKDIARARRNMQLISLLMLDIDGFRQFNEINGYQFGNRALAKISDIIKGMLRDTDFAYRYGGDEIALILTDTDELDALEFAERIQGELKRHDFKTKDGKVINLSISIGIATYPADASDAEGLIQCAREALFLAKEEAGGGVVATYTQTNRPRKVKKVG